MKRLLFLFLLIASDFATAQEGSFYKEIKNIDNLINYSQIDIAQIKIDSLYRVHTKLNNENSNDYLIEIKYRQALIYYKQDRLPANPLRMLLEIKDEAEEADLYVLSYHINLLIALVYEKASNIELTNQYLNNAKNLYKKYKLENYYSSYCVRRSSYYRFVGKFDSLHYYAQKAMEYSHKYNNERDFFDSHILLGVIANRNRNYTEALGYSVKLLKYFKKVRDTLGIAGNFINISTYKTKTGNFSEALLYNDSARMVYNSKRIFDSDKRLITKKFFSRTRSEIFEKMGNTDSAYFYFKQYHKEWVAASEQQENTKTKEIEEQYQNQKKEATIKSKNQQMLLIGIFLAIILIASVLLYLQNLRIKSRNKLINKQLVELSKTVEQKQMLLSELQHRVKNNLQHVISILEIQKESVSFENIDELIRGNQNRIHSMALVHKKLNVAENVNDINLQNYISELSELVKESYSNDKQKINLLINCEIDKISIEKALPIGLIITELLSNSIKHAFNNQSIGIIKIEITENEGISQIYFSDNGIGFDFCKDSEKGLGQEIIKGLIDQLNGTIEAKSKNGFELTIYFKK